MRGFLLGLSISIAFVVGCAASQLIVPPVRAGTAPVRWEYHCAPDIDRPWKVEDLAILNRFGAEGWEIVQQMGPIGDLGANKDVWCFKRPLP